jgi:putative ABC transport system ATP-binding protein
MATVMHLENVYRIFRMGQERIAAVDGVTLDVHEGEILCMQGPSGSGKSTLLHMMAGLDRPSKGSVILGKTHIEKLSEDRLALFRQRHVGFIFQSYYLIPTLTALENVTLPLMFAGISPSRRNKAGKELLVSVGLKDRMRHKPSEMSGGQQQRVSIARAFANNPRIVFADEPTGNLDTHTTYEMMNLMTRLARERNITLVIVTHDLEISGYATRLVKIRDGRIEGIEDGPAHHAGAPPAAADSPLTDATGIKEIRDKASTEEAGDKAGSEEDNSLENTAVLPEPDPVTAGPSTTKRKKVSTGIFGKRKVQSK